MVTDKYKGKACVCLLAYSEELPTFTNHSVVQMKVNLTLLSLSKYERRPNISELLHLKENTILHH
jgi:hypothetical protein